MPPERRCINMQHCITFAIPYAKVLFSSYLRPEEGEEAADKEEACTHQSQHEAEQHHELHTTYGQLMVWVANIKDEQRQQTVIQRAHA